MSHAFPPTPVSRKIKDTNLDLSIKDNAVEEAYRRYVTEKEEYKMAQEEYKMAEEKYRKAKEKNAMEGNGETECQMAELFWKNSFQVLQESRRALREARRAAEIEFAYKKYAEAKATGDSFLIEAAKDEVRHATGNGNKQSCMTPEEFNSMLLASPVLSGVKDAFDSSQKTLLLNPWELTPPKKTGRDNAMRKKSAQYYGRYKFKQRRKKVNLAQCCITDEWGNCDTVVGAHLLPLSSGENITKGLNMENKLNDCRNVMPLLKTIERAYDLQRLCFVLDQETPKPLYRIKILDPDLELETYLRAETFKSLATKTFELPIQKDGSNRPFTRCLNFHAQASYARAVRKGWAKTADEPPEIYGSPLDSEVISFAVPCGKELDFGSAAKNQQDDTSKTESLTE